VRCSGCKAGPALLLLLAAGRLVFTAWVGGAAVLLARLCIPVQLQACSHCSFVGQDVAEVEVDVSEHRGTGVVVGLRGCKRAGRRCCCCSRLVGAVGVLGARHAVGQHKRAWCGQAAEGQEAMLLLLLPLLLLFKDVRCCAPAHS